MGETTPGSKSPPKPKSVDVESDLIGVGAGPANLSLASLLTTARDRGLTSITTTSSSAARPRPEDLRAPGKNWYR